MKWAVGVRRGSSGINFQRLLVVCLVVAACLPLVAVGLIAYGPLQQSLADDAAARVEQGRTTTEAILQRRDNDLDDLATSYAQWPALRTLIADREVGSIRQDVLGFLVAQGSVDDALVVTANGSISAGPDSVEALGLTVEAPGAPARSAYLTVGDGIYAFRDRPIGDGLAEAVGRLVLLRRLDARFAADVRRLTGFDLALVDANGTSILFTDEPSARTAEALQGDRLVEQSGSLAIGRLPLSLEGGRAATIVLTADLSTLHIANGQLPTLLIGLVGLTGVAALVMALALAAVLRRRLTGVHESLTAIADGRVAPRQGDVIGDELSRVRGGLDRVIEALDRREHILRRSLRVAAALSSDRPVGELAEAASSAAVEIFGLRACRVIDADGQVIGLVGGDGGGREVEAPLGLDERHSGSLIGVLARETAWSEADQIQLEVLALLVGTLLRDAQLYGQAADRAERVVQVNRLQREFLRAVSHGLQTPLTTMDLAAEDLIESSGTDAFVRQRAEILRAESRRLARQVAQILTMSRLDAGVVRVELDAVAPGRLARRVWSEIAPDRPLEVVDDGHFALADKAALEQVLSIVLDNANRYAPTGATRVTVGGAEDARVRVLVEDAGPGVPSTERERIFRRFVRGSASGAASGMGLGLGVARGLMRAMDGDLRSVPSELGGAGFALTLPAAGHGGPATPALAQRAEAEAVKS